MVAIESNPPLAQAYNIICSRKTSTTREHDQTNEGECEVIYETLPLVDLKGLTSNNDDERAKCVAQIVRASSEWGFFQVVNHGISPKLLSQMRKEQMELFDASFSRKSTSGLLNNSYRWGTATATSPRDFSWSEAFHIPLTKISDKTCYGEFLSLREVMMEYAAAMQKLAEVLARVLITNLGRKMEDFEETICCDESTCFLRLNKYPMCPVSSSPEIHGMAPHTDSDFLTIVHQDQVGGLQLMRGSKWVAVKPNKDALIVNIGDLFQAWSNNRYKSVEHRVMSNRKMKRFSVAYFLCPSYDSLINKSPLYKDFTFGEYKHKVQEDAKLFGRKIGLSRFLR